MPQTVAMAADMAKAITATKVVADGIKEAVDMGCVSSTIVDNIT